VDEYRITVEELSTERTRSLEDKTRTIRANTYTTVVEDLVGGKTYRFSVEAKSSATGRSTCRTVESPRRQRPLWSWFGLLNQDSSPEETCREPDWPLPVATVTATPEEPPSSKQPLGDVDRLALSGVPSAPGQLVAEAHDGKVTLRWSPPRNEGYCGVTEYSVSVRPVDLWSRSLAPPDRIRSVQHEIVVEQLRNCETYVFEVAAENCRGAGPRTTVTSTPLPISAPAIVTPALIGRWCA